MSLLAIPSLVAAYGLDLLLGDPRWLPHPVRGIGWAIAKGEGLLRRFIGGGRLAGSLLVIGIVGTSYLLTAWLLVWSFSVHQWAGFGMSVFLLYSCLSTRDLDVESRPVLYALEHGDLALARQKLAMIVGRDTDRLDAPEVVRATVETIAESTMDGIIAPLLYTALGGPPLAVAYKAVNTLDSMIGHRSARYRDFGWMAATVDTWANWLPARLSAVMFLMGARICGYRAGDSWRYAWRDGRGGPVPNAGIPEAAMAGALGVQLGGVNWYQGHAVEMPVMGRPDRPLTPPRIREAIWLMYACSLISFVLAVLAVGMWGRPIWGHPASF